MFIVPVKVRRIIGALPFESIGPAKKKEAKTELC